MGGCQVTTLTRDRGLVEGHGTWQDNKWEEGKQEARA